MFDEHGEFIEHLWNRRLPCHSDNITGICCRKSASEHAKPTSYGEIIQPIQAFSLSE